MVPNLLESIVKPAVTPLVREVRAEDLRGPRGTIFDRARCAAVLEDKAILVTGASGSVGSELCRQIATFATRRLFILDNNESGLFDLHHELRSLHPSLAVEPLLADVADESRMDDLFAQFRPQVVFHAAAYKHVPLMEQYPEAAVRVNVGGTLVVLRMARKHHAESFVLVSTDKAVNPESVMGATKRVAELIVLQDRTGPVEGSLSADLRSTAVRFGNVLGSRGSVVPTFARQIEAGGPVTVTHPDMTRYFMDLPEAAMLIIDAAALTTGNDLFMLEMGSPIRIDDLARHMIRLRGLRPDVDVRIVHVGLRPGEKLREQLTFAHELKVPTEHPMVFRVFDPSPNQRVDPIEAAESLLRMARSGERGRLVEELMLLATAPRGASDTVVNGEPTYEQPTPVIARPRLRVDIDA
jgi:FlaA1/EpsC-like NDP-sugar epimerase